MQASSDRKLFNHSLSLYKRFLLASKLFDVFSLLFAVLFISHCLTSLSKYEVLCSSITSASTSSFSNGKLQDSELGAAADPNQNNTRKPNQTPTSASAAAAASSSSRGSIIISSSYEPRKTRATRQIDSADPNLNSGEQNSTSNNNSHQGYMDGQPPILEQCCACDEAKYELVFESLWSRYTHPNDFPEEHNSTYFSDIIGASHSNEFKMWSEGSCATEGVKELATTGSTKKLESELKQVSSKTRTIIKARELRYPTLNSKTSAVFRTDRQHHLVSILSKLGPSPDWVVGVSGLELCRPDCSWTGQSVVNLYLWDAGADSGTTFTGPGEPTYPQEKIHPYKKLPPNHHHHHQQQQQRANIDTNYYYASNGQSTTDSSTTSDSNQSSGNNEQLKPYARLTVTRQRIYEKSCNADKLPIPAQKQQINTYQTLPNNSPDSSNWSEPPIQSSYSDCRFHNWSDWSVCSSTCGRGIRTRVRSFIEDSAHLVGCSQVDLIEKEVCLSECVSNVACITRDWSDWSKCSVDCGQGFRKRTRSPIQPWRRGVCDSVNLAEVEPCIGAQVGNCTQDASSCEVTAWSQWSECSNACGK